MFLSFSGGAGILLAVLALLVLRSRRTRMVCMEGGIQMIPAGGRTYAGSLVAIIFAAVAGYLLVHQHSEEEHELDVRTADLDRREELLNHPPVRMARVVQITPTTANVSHGDSQTLLLELFGEGNIPASYQVRLPLPGFHGVLVGDFVLVHTDSETQRVLAIRKIDACGPSLAPSRLSGI